jgi:serine/threonine protein kinase
MLNLISKAELQFELKKEIGGEGKNSRVYLAEDKQLSAELVVKQMAKAAIPDAAEYFIESSILYKTEHPNVVPVYYACQDADHVYIAMPYLPNGSLNALLNDKFLTVREIIRYAIQFLSGLHNVHSKGLIHFDVKPDNILLSKSGEALISDFGLAKHMDHAGQAEQQRFYVKIVPPEAILGKTPFDVQYDIYQVGITLYRMCVGNVEYYQQWEKFLHTGVLDEAGFVDAVLDEKFPNRTGFPAHIPKALQKIVVKCLYADKAKRYSSVLEVMNALAQLDVPEMDWQFSIKPDGTKRWEHISTGRTLYLEIDVTGMANAQKAGPGGKFSKVKDFCGALLPKKVVDFFKEA